MRVNNQYDESFKADALNLVQRGDRTISEVAQALGVSHWTLRGWCKKGAMSKRSNEQLRNALRPSSVESPEEN